mgnify:CR=1 FL=1
MELKALKKGDGHEPLVDAEINARKITSELEEFIAEYGENAELSTVPYKDKKYYLKVHESKRKITKNQNLSLEDALKETNSLIPFSESLKQFLESQFALNNDTQNSE